jgi:hypothetical protein
VVEAESARLADATVATPASAWTGESRRSNGSYLSLADGGTAEWTLPSSPLPRLVLPVVNLVSPARTTWSTDLVALGTINHAALGPQGISAAPGALQPITLPTPLPPYATTLKATAAGQPQLDAVLLLPTISTLFVGRAALLTSVDAHPRTFGIPTAAGATAYAYTADGMLHSRHPVTSRVVIQPGGFTVVL